MMAKLPVLTTQRMIIQPFTEDFLSAAYIQWLNDPVVTRYSQQRYRRHNRESCLAFMNSFEIGAGHFCAITLKDDEQRHIGNISTTIDVHNKVADIAILIGDASLWGQGYGLEAWQAVQDHLLQSGTRLVTGGCMDSNTAMKALMKKSGMEPYYTRKGYFLHDGQTIDSVHFAIGKIT